MFPHSHSGETGVFFHYIKSQVSFAFLLTTCLLVHLFSLSGLVWVAALSSGVQASQCAQSMSPLELLRVCAVSGLKWSQPRHPPFLRSSCPAHCVTWSYCLLLSEPAGLTPAHGCSPAQVLPPLFPCREAGDTGTSVLQVRDNQSTALIHRASPSSLKAISLSVLDLPIVVNQYCLFLIIFLSFWCLEMFSLRSCLIIFTGTEVKL